MRGRAGLLRENRERKAARHHANALSKHVAWAGKTWERRLEAEREAESWERQKCNVIEVPGLTQRSEVILKHLHRLSQSEKPEFLVECPVPWKVDRRWRRPRKWSRPFSGALASSRLVFYRRSCVGWGRMYP